MLFPLAQLCMMFNLDADCVNIMPQVYFQWSESDIYTVHARSKICLS